MAESHRAEDSPGARERCEVENRMPLPIDKRWLSDGLGLAAARGANVLLGVVTVVLFARALGSTDYGFYVLAVTVAQLIAMPLHMGLPTLLTREIAAGLATGRDDLAKGIQRYSLILIAAGSLTIMAMALIAYAALNAAGWWQFEEAHTHLVVLAGATVPVIALLKRAQGTLAGFGQVFQGYLPDGVARPVLLLAMGAAALSFWQVGPAGLMALYLCAAIIAACFSMWLVARAQPHRLREAATTYNLRPWLASLLPLTGISAVAALNGYSDVVMLGFFTTGADVGHYKVAAQVGAVAFLLQTVGNALLAPRIAAAQARGDNVHLQKIVTFGARFMSGATALVVVAIIAFGPPLITFVFGVDYAPAVPITIVFAVGALLTVLCGPTGTVLNMTHRERTTARLAFASAAVNIVLNLALIPLLGPLGAALATIFALVIMQLNSWHAVRRDFGYRTDAFAIMR